MGALRAGAWPARGDVGAEGDVGDDMAEREARGRSSCAAAPGARPVPPAATVALVGAGPGDPGLLTLRGRDLLAAADVVVHDRLVSPGVLALASPVARLVDVGKRPHRHPVPQGEINRLLVEEARRVGPGGLVVRLKGGDPLVFGRGGEEARALEAAGVACEVVPGVTSAVAAPAAAGVPVTDRDAAAALHVLTGHRRADGDLGIDFDALVRAGGTDVFLMGVATMPELAAGLVAAGADPATPAVVVERGTLPDQRRVDATLGTVATRAAAAGVATPAVLVVGAACALATDPPFDPTAPLPRPAAPRGRA